MDKEQWIEKALANRLSESEWQTFKALLNEDAEMATSYRFEKDLKSALEQEEREQIKSELILHEKKIKKRKWFWAAAAVFLVFFLAGSLLLRKQGSPQQLYTAYYEKFPNVVAPLTRAESGRAEAYIAYDKGEYEKAYTLLGDLENDKAASFYRGICLIESGKTDQAIIHFESLSLDNDFEYHRLWYLSLLYLKTDDVEKARPILDFLAEGRSVWKAKAQRILEAL